jgi:hypothetical protein
LEYFKDIPGYEGIYQVSNCGRIASVKREKILKTIKTLRYDYHVVSLAKGGFASIFRVHRLVAAAFIGKSNLPVNHKDFNRENNHLSNLEYVTCQENTRHAVLAGRHPSSRRRLTPSQIREIRISKLSPRRLAPIFGVPTSSIYSILKNMSYKDVK